MTDIGYPVFTKNYSNAGFINSFISLLADATWVPKRVLKQDAH